MRWVLFLAVLAGCGDKDGEDTSAGSGVKDVDRDGVSDQFDCDDEDPEINPYVTEVCDGIDNNCNDEVDEGFDGDGDGYTSCGGDCDDERASVSPGAEEVCDQEDNDCDEEIDEGVALTLYRDIDNDGFGDPDAAIAACEAPGGYVDNGGDCDDTAPSTYPGAAASDSKTACMRDFDYDGYGEMSPPEGVAAGSDCDDADSRLYPGGAPKDSKTACMRDQDLDGYGDASPASAAAEAGSDCDDADATIHPGAEELCDEKDNDCDGEIEPGVTVTESFDKALSGWSVNGSAEHVLSSGSGYLRLTEASGNEAGTAFYSDVLTVEKFFASFSIEISGGGGADGMAFLFLGETDDTLVGGTGSQLGLLGLTGYAVEFDTYNSGLYSDPNANHVAVVATDDLSIYAADTSVVELSGTGSHDVEVYFDQGDIDVYFDGSLSISTTIADYALTDLMFGFSAATGAVTDEHAVDSFELVTCE